MLSNARAIHITRFDTNRRNEFEAAFITNEKFVRLIWWFVNVNCVSWIELKLGQKIKKFRPLLLFSVWSLRYMYGSEIFIISVACFSRFAVTCVGCLKVNLPCVFKCYALNTYGAVELQLGAVLPSALDGSEWSHSHPHNTNNKAGSADLRAGMKWL